VSRKVVKMCSDDVPLSRTERIARILWHPLAVRRLALRITLSPGLIKERGAGSSCSWHDARFVKLFRPTLSQPSACSCFLSASDESGRRRKVETFCRPRRSCGVKSSVAEGVSRAAGTDWAAATIERTPAD